MHSVWSGQPQLGDSLHAVVKYLLDEEAHGVYTHSLVS